MAFPEVPSTKSQTPRQHQASIFKIGRSGKQFGVWCLEFSWGLGLGIWCFFCGLLTLPAQTQSPSFPQQQDPLMSLMLSQPKVDITTNVTAVASFDPPRVG